MFTFKNIRRLQICVANMRAFVLISMEKKENKTKHCREAIFILCLTQIRKCTHNFHGRNNIAFHTPPTFVGK